MEKDTPQASIFNDVIGPVMRGPSSSHSAAALRIGRIARDLLGVEPKKVEVDYDPNGSLVTTHCGQGSDMGLAGGIFGWEADDERLVDYLEHGLQLGVEFIVNYVGYGATHPNTYRMRVSNGERNVSMTAISTGGGMMEVLECDGCKIQMGGGFYEALVFVDGEPNAEIVEWAKSKGFEVNSDNPGVIQISSLRAFSGEELEWLEANEGVEKLRTANPVLEVLGETGESMPFTNAASLLEKSAEMGESSLARMASLYESARGLGDPDDVVELMKKRYSIIKRAVERGLRGTEYADRILPSQTGKFIESRNSDALVKGDVLNEVILQVTSLMENKSSMGTLVAAPTAGSCGACPGAILGAATALNANEDLVVDALLAAGMVGVFIANGATFAAEEAGCMAECGAGSSMAAAGLVTLMGGDVNTSIAAASMALQNCLGMICDPVADRVEAPCLGKNVLAATNAISSANMALAGFAHLIPLDEVIDAMDRVGKQMPSEHCCTGLGGLAMTPTAKDIEEDLLGKNSKGSGEQEVRSCFKCSC